MQVLYMEYLPSFQLPYTKMTSEEITRHREWLHSHPELSFQEFETQRYIRGVLDELGIPNIAVANTGVLATIGSEHNEAILLRADIDALPIEESSGVEFTSKNQGVMHACGHDVHTASLLGAVAALHSNPPQNRTILALFQPGEEVAPGGAIEVLNSGVLDRYNITSAIALHCSPELEIGTFGLHSGPFMASADEVHINVIGKGGHAARPENHRNPVWAAVDLLSSLHAIEAPANTQYILSFGKVVAAGATNIVPDRVEIAGTLRTFSERWRTRCKSEIERLCSETQALHCLDIELAFGEGYPSVLNDPALCQSASDIIASHFGASSVVEIPQRMTAEDFGHITQRYPSLMVRLGVGISGTENSELHRANFCPAPESAAIGSELMEKMARELNL